MLTFFAIATLSTSILSVGAYCLTSDGGDTRSLHAAPILSDSRSMDSAEDS